MDTENRPWFSKPFKMGGEFGSINFFRWKKDKVLGFSVLGEKTTDSRMGGEEEGEAGIFQHMN